MGNTTILAEFATHDEVSRFLAQAQPSHLQCNPARRPPAGWQSREDRRRTQSDPGRTCSESFGGSTGLGQWSSSAGGSSGADLAGVAVGPPTTLLACGSPKSQEDLIGWAALLLYYLGDLLGENGFNGT